MVSYFKCVSTLQKKKAACVCFTISDSRRTYPAKVVVAFNASPSIESLRLKMEGFYPCKIQFFWKKNESDIGAQKLLKSY